MTASKFSTNTGLRWRPEVYNKLATAQEFAAQSLISRLNISKDSDILDIGCGDGKITVSLAQLASDGSVTGIDKSAEMIAFAKSQWCTFGLDHLEFQIGDAQQIDYQSVFDVLFSSFALQWVKDKQSFFRRAFAALRPGGQLAIVIPLGVSVEFEASVAKVIATPRWHEWFHDFTPEWHFIHSDSLLKLAEQSGFILSYCSEFTQVANFSSLSEFTDYVSLWFPYFQPLKKELHSDFFNEVLEDYLTQVPLRSDGSVEMRIPAVSLVGERPSSE